MRVEKNINLNKFELVYGQEKLVNKCRNLEFFFYPQSYYPIVFESYECLNTKLASMIEKTHTQNKNDIIIECDAANGVLAVLCRDFCKKYHLIEHNKISYISTEANLKTYGVDTQDKTTISFGIHSFRRVCKELNPDARVTVVFQEFILPMIEYDRQKSKQ